MVTAAIEIAAMGYGVDLVLVRAEGPYLAELPHNVRVIDLSAKRVVGALPGLIGYLRKERPAALLSTMRHANMIAILANRLARVGTRVVVREANTIGAALEEKPSFIENIMPKMMAWIYPFADEILAVSGGVADELIKHSKLRPESITVIYNPVVTSIMLEKADLPVNHEWLGDHNKPVIVSAGRLDRQKDFSTLIKAFALVREQRDVRLLILGEGEERQDLEALISELGLLDNVSLPGFAENPFNYMKHADLYVLSSLWEGLPNGLIQAMALGARVVSTDCPSGPDEILESGKWGNLVPVNDTQSLAAAILSSLKPEQEELHQQRVDYTVARFGAPDVSKQYLNLLLGTK